jgi:hypothetical protein
LAAVDAALSSAFTSESASSDTELGIYEFEELLVEFSKLVLVEVLDYED